MQLKGSSNFKLAAMRKDRDQSPFEERVSTTHSQTFSEMAESKTSYMSNSKRINMYKSKCKSLEEKYLHLKMSLVFIECNKFQNLEQNYRRKR
jgi:hypothetical protein